MLALTVKLKFKSFYVKIKSDKPRNASVKADGTEYVCILFLFARCKHTEIMRTIIKTDTNSLCYSFLLTHWNGISFGIPVDSKDTISKSHRMICSNEWTHSVFAFESLEMLFVLFLRFFPESNCAHGRQIKSMYQASFTEDWPSWRYIIKLKIWRRKKSLNKKNSLPSMRNNIDNLKKCFKSRTKVKTKRN